MVLRIGLAGPKMPLCVPAQRPAVEILYAEQRHTMGAGQPQVDLPLLRGQLFHRLDGVVQRVAHDHAEVQPLHKAQAGPVCVRGQADAFFLAGLDLLRKDDIQKFVPGLDPGLQRLHHLLQLRDHLAAYPALGPALGFEADQAVFQVVILLVHCCGGRLLGQELLPLLMDQRLHVAQLLLLDLGGEVVVRQDRDHQVADAQQQQKRIRLDQVARIFGRQVEQLKLEIPRIKVDRRGQIDQRQLGRAKPRLIAGKDPAAAGQRHAHHARQIQRRIHPVPARRRSARNARQQQRIQQQVVRQNFGQVRDDRIGECAI